MPTSKKRINITLDDLMWDAIEDYRYEKRLTSKSQAAVALMEIGIAAENSGKSGGEYLTIAANADKRQDSTNLEADLKNALDIAYKNIDKH